MPKPTTYTVYLCDECGHRSMDHPPNPTQANHNTCSIGWCPCVERRADIEATATPIQHETIPDRMAKS